MDNWNRQFNLFVLLYVFLIGWILSLIPITEAFGVRGLIPWGIMFILWLFVFDYVLGDSLILNSIKRRVGG